MLFRWLATAAAVGAAAYLVPGIRIAGGPVALLGAALAVGLVNALVRPIVRRLACGLIVITLGLFILVVNAGMLLLAAWLARQVGVGFEVDGFVPALQGTIVISLVSFVLSLLAPERSE